MNSTINCPYCKKSFETADAIGHQIEVELLRTKAEQSETLRNKFDVQTEVRINTQKCRTTKYIRNIGRDEDES